jgi:hypothetical protein
VYYRIITAPTREERAALNRSIKDYKDNYENDSSDIIDEEIGSLESVEPHLQQSDSLRANEFKNIIKPGHFTKENSVEEDIYDDDFS